MKRRVFLGLLSVLPVALSSCTSVTATIDSVMRVIPMAVEVCRGIITIVATTVATGDYEQQIDALAGDVIAALTVVREILREHRQDLEKAPDNVIAMLDSAVARIADNLEQILNVVRVYDPKIQAAVGSAVAALQTVLLGIAALVPADKAAMFPRTAHSLANENRALGNIKAVIPTPHHLAAIYNLGIGKDFKSAKIHVPFGFLPW